MTQRCTNGSIMCRGGMIELSKRSAWVVVGAGAHRQVHQLTDATFLHRFATGDVIVLDTPHGFVPDASMFTDATLPDDVRRRVTSSARAMGVDHLDRPMGKQEQLERSKLVTKTLNRITHASGGGQARRDEIIAKFGRELDTLMTTRGGDDVVEMVARILAETPGIAPAAVIRALHTIPTMSERLGAPPATGIPTSGRDVAPARPTRALAALGFTSGARPAAALSADLSDPRSVSPHAVLRFLERIDGRIAPELIDASRNVLRAKAEGNVEEARRRLVSLVHTHGLDAERVAEVRSLIAGLVTDAADASLDRPDRAVIAGRPAHDAGCEADRVVLGVKFEGRSIELLVRAARVQIAPGRPPRVSVEIITLWEPSTVALSKKVWEDHSIPAEFADEWNRATEAALYAAMTS